MNQQVDADKVLAILKRKTLPKFEHIEEVCEFVTKYMVKRYNLSEPGLINCGYCFIWAYLVWALWPKGGVEFTSTDGHVAVRYQGYYFDAEHPDGEAETDWVFNSYDEDLMDINVHGLAWYWCRDGLEKMELRRIIRNTCRPIYNWAVRGGWGNNQGGNSVFDIP
jgi:hypothetical protein